MSHETKLQINQTSELVARLDALAKEIDGMREFAQQHNLNAVEDLCNNIDRPLMHFVDEHLRVSIVGHCSQATAQKTTVH